MFRKHILRQSIQTQAYIEFLEQKIAFYQEKVAYYRKQISRIMNNTNDQTDNYRQFAFIIVKESQIKKEILKKWPNYFLSFIFPKVSPFKKRHLRLRSAPDSNDIILENIHISEKLRILYKYLIILVAAFIMGCFYLIIYSIVEYTGLKIGNQNGGTSLDNTNLEFFIYNRVLGSVFIMVLNKIIERIFIYLARFPSFETFTRQERFSLNLIGFLQFLNTFVMTFINYLFVSFFYQIFASFFEGNLDFLEEVFQEFGQYFTTIFLFIMLIPFAHFLNVSQIYKFYQRHKAQKQDLNLTQKELNRVFENVQLEIIDFYFDFTYIYLISFFMFPFNPLWVFPSIISLIILYWVYKFLLLRVFCIKKQRSERTFFSLVNMIRIGPLVHSFGLCSLNIRDLIFYEDYNKNSGTFEKAFGMIVFVVLCMELVSYYLCFCNSKFLRGLNIQKNRVRLEEVKSQVNCYNLFESMDFDSEKEDEEEKTGDNLIVLELEK